MAMMEGRVKWIVCLIVIIAFVGLAEGIFENNADPVPTGYSNPAETSESEPYRGGGLTTYEAASEYAIEGGTNIFTPAVEIFVVDFPGMPAILIFILTLMNTIMIGVVAWIILTAILDALPLTGG